MYSVAVAVIAFVLSKTALQAFGIWTAYRLNMAQMEAHFFGDDPDPGETVNEEDDEPLLKVVPIRERMQ